MDSEEIISLYVWESGVCFRHPERGQVDTAKIKTLHPRSGPDTELRVCRDCLLAFEAMRRASQEKTGGDYEPGHVAE